MRQALDQIKRQAAPGPHGLVCQLLIQGQLCQKSVHHQLAVQIGLPLTQCLGHPFGRLLEGEHALRHGVQVSHHLRPQHAPVAGNRGDHVRVQPAVACSPGLHEFTVHITRSADVSRIEAVQHCQLLLGGLKPLKVGDGQAE